MKQVFLFLIFCCFAQSVFSQDTLSKEDITGRWVEVKETDNKYPYTYIFRDNNIFHLGEASEGIILFNVAGKYSIQGDSINVVYYDFLEGSARNRIARQVSFKVISIDNGVMTTLVTDYGYSYKLVLRKQDIINENKNDSK
ncbi:MAG: hypothetical protein LBN74_08545 [Prevotella sp.]|jgi:hypothetical protein|nr:hypothetical protein [Prevotella sp.]